MEDSLDKSGKVFLLEILLSLKVVTVAFVEILLSFAESTFLILSLSFFVMLLSSLSLFYSFLIFITARILVVQRHTFRPGGIDPGNISRVAQRGQPDRYVSRTLTRTQVVPGPTRGRTHVGSPCGLYGGY